MLSIVSGSAQARKGAQESAGDDAPLAVKKCSLRSLRYGLPKRGLPKTISAAYLLS